MFGAELRRFWSRMLTSITCSTLPRSCVTPTRDSSPAQRQFDWSSRSEFRLTNAKSYKRETREESGHGRLIFSPPSTIGCLEKFHSREDRHRQSRSKSPIGRWVNRSRLWLRPPISESTSTPAE